MEIIKLGNLDKKDGMRTFTCEKCGCIFKAKYGEYKHNFSQIESTDWYEIKCPYCGTLVILNNER